jgi:formate C-acetyltransferase
VATSSIQFESDDLMRPEFASSDYAISCCVSAMRVGKDMQYFGARTNLPKLLLYVLNGGRDEVSGEQVGPAFAPVRTGAGPLDYDEVMAKVVGEGMDWLAELYCNTMNVIHYMHDKYNYERVEMALHDTHVRRLLAFGVSGLSVAADSLSAIRHARVTPVVDARGLMTEFRVEGEYPKYGNDDARVDAIARELVERFSERLRRQRTYRASVPTLSVLTITSNVVYGKATGGTPCGRRAGEPYGPGANAFMHRETSGALAALATIAGLPYAACLDGISNTFSVVPSVLGKTAGDREANLAGILDGYFRAGGHHINVNVFDKALFLEASRRPEDFPNLTVRISGYACHWRSLTDQQKAEFLTRSFHGSM